MVLVYLDGFLIKFVGQGFGPVLIATRDQLTTALGLIELDGVARRLTLLPPDLPHEHVSAIAAKAEVYAVVGSEDTHEANVAAALKVICRPQIAPVVCSRLGRRPT